MTLDHFSVSKKIILENFYRPLKDSLVYCLLAAPMIKMEITFDYSLNCN